MDKRQNCAVCGSENCASFTKLLAQMHPVREEFNFDRCADCGYVFLNPPAAMSELANYYTEFYLPYRGPAAWGKYSGMVEDSDRKLNDKRAGLLADRGLGPESLVLDIGCGKPAFLERCVERFGCRGFGLDFSDQGWRGESVDVGKLTLMVGEVADLPPDLRPDAVTMWHYLEHDYDPGRTLRHIASLSRPETTLVVEVPDFESSGREKYGGFWAGYHTPRHISVFSENNLRTLLGKNGWEVERIDRFGTLDPYVLDWMSRMEQKGIEWNKSMESEFWSFVAGMLAFAPTKLREKSKPLGLMTAVARPL